MSRAASSDALSVLEPSWSRTITKVSVELPDFVRAASSEALAMSRAASSEALARLEPGWSRITKVSEELEQLTSALWEFQRANVIEPARAAAAASGPALAIVLVGILPVIVISRGIARARPGHVD